MRSNARSKSGRLAVVHFPAFGGASVLASRGRRVLMRQGRLVSSLAPPNFATGGRSGRCLKIEWHDQAWRPRLVVRFGGRQDPDWRVSVLDCGGKRSAAPLSGWSWHSETPRQAFTLMMESKAVSPPPHSRTASAIRNSSRRITFPNL